MRQSLGRSRWCIASSLAVLVLHTAPGVLIAQDDPPDFDPLDFISSEVKSSQGVTAGTNEAALCVNGTDGENGVLSLCSFTSPGPVSVAKSYSAEYIDTLFGGVAQATATVSSGTRYFHEIAIESQPNPKIGGRLFAQGPIGTNIINMHATFGASYSDRLHLEPTTGHPDLIGRLVMRLRLTGDVVIGPGPYHSYTLYFLGGPGLEASYHADNHGVEAIVADGIEFILNPPNMLTLQLTITAENVAAIANLLDREFTVGLSGHVIAEQGEQASLDLNQTLEFESIAVYTESGDLYPGLALTSQSGAVYPFLNARNGPGPPGSSTPVPALTRWGLAVLVLALLGTGLGGFWRHESSAEGRA